MNQETVRKVILWDFDNTLGSRRGIWGHPLLDVLKAHHPDSDVTHEDISPFLQGGFPWHQPEVPHPELNEPDDWWQAMLPLFQRAYEGVGLDVQQARALAAHVRDTFVHPDGWFLFDDTLDTLQALRDAGWKHIVVSNHIPELSDLIEHLGLDPLMERVYSSALMGYEKPHPQLFRMVLDELGPVDDIWMVGDNFDADILGAGQVGIPGILVRKFHADAEIFCSTLTDVIDVVCR